MSTESDQKLRDCRVLLVDDEETILLSLGDSLREAGAAVITASTGDGGALLLAEQAFDVVVSDVRMPGMSGMDLLARLREGAGETEVILMTAYANVDHAMRAMKLGAYDYVTKPFPNEKMVQVVENAWTTARLRCEIRDLKGRTGVAPSLGDRPLAEVVDDFERSFLERAIREFRGTRSDLARALGISRKNLWEKIRKFAIKEPEDDP